MSRFSVLIFALLISTFVHGKVRYWVGTGSNTNWNATGNWSASSGGSGGATLPDGNDTAYFNGSGTGNCAFNINVSIKYLAVSSDYTGTLSQGASTFTIGSKGAVFTGGTFSGGSASITSSGPFIISGTSYTSTSSSFTLADNFTFSSGSFNSNNGLFKFTKTCTITGSASFYDLEFNGTSLATYTVASGTTVAVTGELKFAGTNNFTLLGGTIDAQGNITVTNTSSGGTRTTQLNITGTNNQTLTGSGVAGTGYLPSININKSGGILTLNSIICVLGDWIYITGTVDAVTNSSSVYFRGSILDGEGTSSTMEFYDLGIASDVTLNGKIRVFNLLDIFSNKSLNTNSSGNYEIDLAGNFVLHGTFTCNQGLVKFTGSSSISGSTTFYNLEFNSTSATSFAIASATTLTVTGELKFSGSSNFSLTGGTLDAQGNITVTNTSTGGNRTTQLNITGTSNQTLTGSGTVAAGYLPPLTINKTGGTLSLSSTISVLGDWTYTTGTVDANTNSSTVVINGSSLDGEGASGTMQFNNLQIYSNVTLAGKLNVAGSLIIASSKTLNTSATSNFEIDLGGDFQNLGTFTCNEGLIKFNGAADQSIMGNSTVTFYNLTADKPNGQIVLQIPIDISHTLTLTNGRIITTSANILTIKNGATASEGSETSLVQGPLKKIGNSAFTFPIGYGTVYSPLEVTAPSSVTEELIAEYFPQKQQDGDNLDTTFESLTQCEYWRLTNPTGGNPSITATIHFSQDDCMYGLLSKLVVSEWNSSSQKWENRGNSATTGTISRGSIKAASTISHFGTLTIGSVQGNYYYIPMTKLKYDGGYHIVACTLPFEFREDYESGSLDYAIYDESRTEKMSSQSNPITKSYGENYIRISLQAVGGFESGKMYFLEITDEKKVIYVTKFKYQPFACKAVAQLINVE